ncbi:unnamed protein product [Linum tenue]|uniref:Prp31 C-terminal domain-containing protein n=1 Tax=Linum tenue TaxID=586396 RepID=A0AAV0IRQ4_9ROSI|nr:unnamed protein product [Linum tenue]
MCSERRLIEPVIELSLWIMQEKGEGYGMLGQAGGRKDGVAARQSKPAAKKCRDRQFGSSGTTSGLTSSLAFALVQGIELSNHKLPHINCAVESKVPT